MQQDSGGVERNPGLKDHVRVTTERRAEVGSSDPPRIL